MKIVLIKILTCRADERILLVRPRLATGGWMCAVECRGLVNLDKLQQSDKRHRKLGRVAQSAFSQHPERGDNPVRHPLGRHLDTLSRRLFHRTKPNKWCSQHASDWQYLDSSNPKKGGFKRRKYYSGSLPSNRRGLDHTCNQIFGIEFRLCALRAVGRRWRNKPVI